MGAAGDLENRILESKRLYIKPFAPEDFGKLFSLHAHPDVAKTTIDGIQNKEAVQKDLDSFIDHQNEHGYSQWAVYEKNSDAFIGRAGITKRALNKEVGVNSEVRFAFLPDSWGNGYASEVALAIKECARDNLKLKKITASTNPVNKASMRVLEKVGFKYSGLIIPKGYGRKMEITYYELIF